MNKEEILKEYAELEVMLNDTNEYIDSYIVNEVEVELFLSHELTEKIAKIKAMINGLTL